MLGLFNASNMNNATVGHNVVCKYYDDNGGYITLGFMDPNYTSMVYTATPESQFPNSFYYPNGSCHYWCYSID